MVSAMESQSSSGRAGYDLQVAINAAGNGDTLVLRGRCVGYFRITDKDLTLRGRGSAGLDAGGEIRALMISGASVPEVSMDNLTVSGGSNEGIYNYGHLTMRKMTTTGNTTGIINRASGTLDLRDSVVEENTHAGVVNWSATTTLSHATLRRNGTGVNNQGARAVLHVTRSVVSDNGRGIQNVEGQATVRGTNVSSNGPQGGISDITDSATLVVDGCRIIDNRNANGGGIYNGGSPLVENSRLIGNVADFSGGGIYSTGGITLKKLSFASNTPNDCTGC